MTPCSEFITAELTGVEGNLPLLTMSLCTGKPIIVFDGTSLPGVTFAPDVGVSVPMRDSIKLSQALQRLIDNPSERLERGQKGRKMAELHYSDDHQAQRLVEIYKMVQKTHKNYA